MEDQSNSFIDEDGKVWTNLGDGISITNFDGSLFVPIDWNNLGGCFETDGTSTG